MTSIPANTPICAISVMAPIMHGSCQNHKTRGGCADIARTQTRVEHVASFGDGGDERMIDPGPIVAVPLRLWLVAMHLDQQAVDIQRDAGAPPFSTRGWRPASSSATTR
jgi:hypothetical protein